jgi:hypothetical protein
MIKPGLYAIATGAILTVAVSACGGGGNNGSAQSIMDSESSPSYTSVPMSDLLTTPLPAADVSSSASGITIGTGPDTNQVIAVLTPAGTRDPALTAEESAAKAAGITVTVNGNVLTMTGPISAFNLLP